jgi:hypothetical protein
LVINDPEPGLIRISVNGDWTNAGAVSVTVSAQSLVDPIPQFTMQNSIAANQTLAVPFQVPAGTAELDIRAIWRQGWENFPPSDIDVYLLTPTGGTIVAGATLNAPERVKITNPAPGNWLALVYGYEVQSAGDKVELRIALDGVVRK